MTLMSAAPGKSFVDIRRWIAILFLGCWLIAPALTLLQSDTESSLPICCRRDGKHHCMMNMAVRNPGKGFRTADKRCALFPKPFTPAAGPHWGSSILVHEWLPRATRTLAFLPELILASPITTLRSHRKRGPPSANSQSNDRHKAFLVELSALST
jgi:hypothetical protein